MRVYLLGIASLCIIFSCSTTRYYVVRHAEKTSNDCNAPLLNPEGFQRANTLRDTLLSKGIDSIFVSICLRTQQTAQPLATALGISLIQFNTTNTMTDSLIRRLKKMRGKDILIVGHTNTVPAIVLGLSGVTINPIADSDFDNMFIIHVRRCFGNTRRSLRSTTYGVITN